MTLYKHANYTSLNKSSIVDSRIYSSSCIRRTCLPYNSIHNDGRGQFRTDHLHRRLSSCKVRKIHPKLSNLRAKLNVNCRLVHLRFLEVPRLKHGSESAMARTQQLRTIGHYCRSWHCLMELTRTIDFLAL